MWYAGVSTDVASISTPQPIVEDSCADPTTAGGSQQAEASRSEPDDVGDQRPDQTAEPQERMVIRSSAELRLGSWVKAQL